MSNVVPFSAMGVVSTTPTFLTDHVLLWEGVVLSEPVFVVDLVEADGAYLTLGCWPTYRQARAHAEDLAKDDSLPIREERP